MTTTELTGAEDVAWDLSDLYESGDDPRLEPHVQEVEEAAAAFRGRYYGRVAELGVVPPDGVEASSETARDASSGPCWWAG